MQTIFDQINEWIKDFLIGCITGNLGGLFDEVNTRVGEIAGQVGQTPSGFNGGVFSMIQNISETVMIPIAGMILTFVCCYELIQMIIEKNNMHDVDTFMFFKWIFKTTVAVYFALGDMQTTLEAMEIPELFGLTMETLIIGLTMKALSLCIFIIVYGRMLEIYLMTSLGPIPMATMANREWGQLGQNYLKSLFALGFQGFLIMVCVGIYAVLVQTISISSGDIHGAIWGCAGYTLLLCFALFKTGSLAKSVFSAH